MGFSLCANETLTLDGRQNGSVAINGEWSQIAGPSVVIDNPSNLKSTISGLEFVGGNDITLRLTATCVDGTLISQDVTFTIVQISNADAGDSFGEFCPGVDVVNLAANTPGAGETGIWTSSGAGVVINDPTNPSSSVTLLSNESGTATLTWTIENVNGCVSSDQTTITNLGGESPVSAGADITLDNCYSTTQSTSLSASNGGDGTGGQIGTWTVVDGPNLPTIADINDNQSFVSNLIEGTYTLRWTVEGPCVNGMDEMMIIVAAPDQEITTADAGSSTAYCDGRESSFLIGNTPEYEDETVLWEFISGPSTPTIENPNSPVTAISGLNGGGSGSYLFSYTINNAAIACSTVDQVNIEYISLPVLTVNSGEDSINVS